MVSVSTPATDHLLQLRPPLPLPALVSPLIGLSARHRAVFCAAAHTPLPLPLPLSSASAQGVEAQFFGASVLHHKIAAEVATMAPGEMAALRDALLAQLTRCSAAAGTHSVAVSRPCRSSRTFWLTTATPPFLAVSRFIAGPRLVRLRLVVALAQFMVNTVPTLWTNVLPQVSRAATGCASPAIRHTTSPLPARVTSCCSTLRGSVVPQTTARLCWCSCS